MYFGIVFSNSKKVFLRIWLFISGIEVLEDLVSIVEFLIIYGIDNLIVKWLEKVFKEGK